MGVFDNIAAELSRSFSVPTSAAKQAVALVVKAHAGDAAAKAHILRAASGPSALLRNILGAAHASLKASPAFWTAHYASKAAREPLHPSHPYAAHIGKALGATAAVRQLSTGHGHGGGGGGHGGHHHGGHHGRGGGGWGGGWGWDPFYEGPEYILLDERRLDEAQSPGAMSGSPEYAHGFLKGGN
jgi:hypothetical protein